MLLPTPPPSPGNEDEQKPIWVVKSRHELFHKQPGFQCYDPFVADRDKQARTKRLRLQPATQTESIDLNDEDGDTPTTFSSDEDPFGPDGTAPCSDKKWGLNFLRGKSKLIETSRCCMEADAPTYGMPGYVVDDRCESAI